MSSKLLRVTQLDAVQLDNEIYRILKNTFDEAIHHLPPGVTVPYEPEINLIIKLLLFNYSILKNNATFGQKLLLIKYDNFTNIKKYLFVLLSSVDYLQERLEMSNKYGTVVTSTELILKIVNFINLSMFLRTGLKPNLIDRLLNLDQIYVKENVPRQFGNKYLTRELVWNGFIEFLVFIIPLINYHKLKRFFRNIFTFQKRRSMPKTEHRLYNLMSRCPHCLEVPIHPHHMGCAHVFCYVCLKSNQMADNNYECPLCFYSDTICERVAVM